MGFGFGNKFIRGITISLLLMLPPTCPSAYNWLAGTIVDFSMIRKAAPCCVEIPL